MNFKNIGGFNIRAWKIYPWVQDGTRVEGLGDQVKFAHFDQ
jgi:hypothetical protein